MNTLPFDLRKLTCLSSSLHLQAFSSSSCGGGLSVVSGASLLFLPSELTFPPINSHARVPGALLRETSVAVRSSPPSRCSLPPLTDIFAFSVQVSARSSQSPDPEPSSRESPSSSFLLLLRLLDRRASASTRFQSVTEVSYSL